MTCGISGFVDGMASAASGTCTANPTEILEKAFLKPTIFEFHPGQKQTMGTSNLEAPGFHPKSLSTHIKIYDLRSKGPPLRLRMTCGISGFVDGAATAASGTCPKNTISTLLKPTIFEIHPDQKQTTGTSNLEASGFHPKSLCTCKTSRHMRFKMSKIDKGPLLSLQPNPTIFMLI